jgi:polysaccharide pyruvyl transferase WcaK-like protein
MKEIGYCCFTDTSNIGDFALYTANKEMFSNYQVVNSNSTELVSNVNIFGGGTLYPYCLRYGKYPKRKFEAAIGQGVIETTPKARFSLPTHAAMLIRRMRFFGVRGEQSQAVLKRHGIKSIVTGDSALYLKSDSNITSEFDLIGVNIVGEEMQRTGSKELVTKSVHNFCKKMIAQGHRIALIPCCINDRESMLSLRASQPEKFEFIDFWGEEINQDLPLFFDQLKRCQFILAERLHAAVFSALLNIPFLSIGYKAKCYDFVSSLKLPHDLIIEPEKLMGGEEIYNYYKAIVNQDELIQMMEGSVNNLRLKLRDAAAEISLLIEKSKL